MENQINPVKSLQSESNRVNPKNKSPFFVGGIIVIIIILIATGLTVWKYYKEISDLNNQEFEIVNFSINKKTKTNDKIENSELVENNNSENYLSSVDVYFSEEKQGKITLYSPDMKIDENKSIWCGGPVIGSKKYQGNFYLSFENSKLNIGKMNFIEDSRNDGKLWIKKLNPKNNQDFIVILQYGSCNYNEAKFYGYDFVQKKLVQYKFKKKSGEIWDEIYVGPTDNFLKILSSKNFSSTLNDGLLWKFNDEENIFEEIVN
jgi:hypothetical protein